MFALSQISSNLNVLVFVASRKTSSRKKKKEKLDQLDIISAIFFFISFQFRFDSSLNKHFMHTEHHDNDELIERTMLRK